jgi:Holliday junction resolvase RusA-like endonuclease
VYGKPATAGSKRGFPIRRKDGTIGVAMTHDNPRAKNWMASVAQRSREVYQGGWMTGPLELEIRFYMARPKGHYRKSQTLKDSAPRRHYQKPDTTKLLRAVEDALTGVLWRDDSQIVILHISKYWTDDSEGADIVVKEIE